MKFLRLLLVLALVMSPLGSEATMGLPAIQSKIKNAGNLWDKDPVKAQSQLRSAFADAILWTHDKYVNSVRERAFFLAVSCSSPDIAEEVVLAAETYEKLFPEGRNLLKVYLFQAMAEYSRNKVEEAEKALQKAVALKKKLSHSQQTYVFSGLSSTGKHRSAERFIEGQRMVNPSARLKKDLRRFHSGNRLAAGVLKKLAAGKIAPDRAVETLESVVMNAPFAKQAPQVALYSISLRDAQGPFYNSLRTSWCGLERVVKHGASPQIRLKKLEEFLINFPEAASHETFKALRDLYYLYLLEFRRQDKAFAVFEKMSFIEDFRELYEIERLVGRIDEHSIKTIEGYADLQRLKKLDARFPYDNGVMPVVSREFVDYLLALGDMIHGNRNNLSGLKQVGWGKLPVQNLYDAATGNKSQAYDGLKNQLMSLPAPVAKMIRDLIFPLYKPIREKDRLFLAGLASVEALPDLGTDLIVESVSSLPRMLKAEHGLAVLADVYGRRHARAEAQKVWKTLSDLYPDSIWLK